MRMSDWSSDVCSSDLLVLSAIGDRATPVPGLPFDPDRAVVPNVLGRVGENSGVYVAGWLKRGPSGGIGTNKWCAMETVSTLVADHEAGRLSEQSRADLHLDLPGLGLSAWAAIDRHERDRGRAEEVGRAAGRERRWQDGGIPG